MKLSKKKIINLVLLFMWMGLIFFMSSNNGEKSTGQSDLVITILSSTGINLSGSFGEFASVIVRKAAHVCEYMILSLLLYNVLKDYIRITKKIMIYTIIGVILYAMSDELHQMFVPGRAGRIQDVFIDTIGGVIGLVAIKIINKMKRSRSTI